MEKRQMASMADIAQYWYEQLEAYHKIEADKPPFFSRAFYADPFEPCCFGCGWAIPEIYLLDHKDPDLRTRWSYASGFLDRAHLVDHVLGGTGDPENLVPLCRYCHEQMTESYDRRGDAIEFISRLQPVPMFISLYLDDDARGWDQPHMRSGNHVYVARIMRSLNQHRAEIDELVQIELAVLDATDHLVVDEESTGSTIAWRNRLREVRDGIPYIKRKKLLSEFRALRRRACDIMDDDAYQAFLKADPGTRPVLLEDYEQALGPETLQERLDASDALRRQIARLPEWAQQEILRQGPSMRQQTAKGLLWTVPETVWAPGPEED